ncbi:hypothetical protein INR49_005979 [Caranx melampygus]|nr:hypothetical protein INR49_019198 [Caranx melampygus]KAG7234037.1 hypothetical protein INR49_005979 [Caranx melampygus]
MRRSSVSEENNDFPSALVEWRCRDQRIASLWSSSGRSSSSARSGGFLCLNQEAMVRVSTLLALLFV